MTLRASFLVLLMTASALAQQPAPAQRGGDAGGRGGRGGGRGAQAPPVVSPEVSVDRKITFRLSAPQGQSVRLSAGDIPGLGQAAVLVKGENGIWSTTVGPVEPGAYRYNFNVDGVATIDPRSPSISESNTNVWSLVYVPGADFMDTKNVPHGAVASVDYFSTAINAWRRLHVYTPPGYETSNDKYPVFYLLHGAGDNDHSWTSVGRANYILDNLIAAKKAKPMVVVMPYGRAGESTTINPLAPPPGPQGAVVFPNDVVPDVIPFV